MNEKIVKYFMTTPAITCEETTSIKEAINLMKSHNIGFIPITKKGIITGVITDRDILIRAIGIYKLNAKINKIMTNGNIYFVSPTTKIKDAAEKMANNKIRRLIVMDDGKAIGVLTTKNLLNENEIIPLIKKTYLNNNILEPYSIYSNFNPHDSIKTSDYPL